MFLTVHAVAGEVLAQHVQTPLLAFGIGFASHFLVDAFPHGDEGVGERARSSNRTARFLIGVTLLDLGIMASVQAWAFANHLLPWTLVPLAAVFGALLPDALQVPAILTRKTTGFWAGYSRFHSRFHNILGIRLGIKWGLVFQSVTLIFLINVLA